MNAHALVAIMQLAGASAAEVGAQAAQAFDVGQSTHAARAYEVGQSALATLSLLGLWLTLKAGVIAMAVWLDLASPATSKRIVEAYRQPGTRLFWIGVLNAVLGGLIGVLLMATTVLAPLGMAWLALWALIGVAGFAAAYHHLGRRLRGPDATGPRWRTIALGGLVAEGAFLVPVLGQLLAAGVFFRGFGAVSQVLITRRRQAASDEPSSSADTPPADE